MSDYTLLLDAPGEPAKQIQIAQLGDFKHKTYGDFSITPADIAAWQENLARLPGQRAVIDLDHRSDRNPRNSEAAGWITGVDLVGGKPMASVEWTPVGRTAIEEKRYLFFSPSYGSYSNESGETFENVLQGGALTNKPFLKSLPTISLADPERVSEAYEQMYELDVSAGARKQAAKDGNALSDGSYPIRNAKELHSAAVLAASGHGDVAGAKKLIRKRAAELGVTLSHLPGFADDSKSTSADSPKSMATVTDSALKLLDLDDTADDTAVETAIQKLLDNATAPAPEADTETVKQLEAENKTLEDTVKTLESTVNALKLSHAEIEQERAEAKFDSAFTEALRTGRTVAGQRDVKRELYDVAPDLVLKELEEGPVVINVKPSGWKNEVNNPDANPTPPGVRAEDFQLHQAIKTYMAENNLKSTEFPKVLEQAINGEIQFGATA